MPQCPCPGGQHWWRGGAVVGGGDHVDHLDGLLSLAGDGAADLGYLSGAGEVDPAGKIGRRGQDLDGAPGLPAVAGLDVAVGGHVPPGQVLARGVQLRLVGLDGEDVVPAGTDDQRGGVGLGMHGVDADHDTTISGQVEPGQNRSDGGDLARK
jgi:hypothetical protein